MAEVSGTTNQLSGPVWAGDFLDREHLMPGGAKLDASQFLATDGATVTLTALAAEGAVALAVAALANSIPAGTLLYFGGAGKFARVTVAAAAGATALTVEALPTALANADVATYAGTGTKPKTVVSGTPVGRTYVERDAGGHFGPAVSTDDEIFLVAFDVTDAAELADVELYRHRSIVKENFLPGWSTMAGALKTALRARYQCTIGQA
jgi:hypothetical protein